MLGLLLSFSIITATITTTPTHAACFNPAGSAGNVLYNAGYRTFQYCNGGSWQKMGGAGDINSNLVGWWKFDETSGTTTADSSGNGNTGTLINSPTWTTSGMNNGALTFASASSQYVDAGNAAGLQLGRTGTVAVWAKYTVTGTMLVSKDDNVNDLNGYALWPNDAGGFAGEIANASNSNSIGSTATYDDGNWHHVVFTWNGSWLNLYVDGAVAATPVAQTLNPVSNVYNLQFGRNSSGVGGYYGYYSGSMDDARVYNRALSATDIKTLYTSTGGTSGDITSNLVGYWKLDETTGTSASDSTGNGHTGTLVNTPTWTASGKINGALSFVAASSQYVSIPSFASNDTAMTYSYWVYIASADTQSNYARTLHVGGAFNSLPTNGVDHELNNTNYPGSNMLSISNWSGGAWVILGAITLNYDAWNNVIETVNGNNATVYLNGAQVLTGSGTRTTGNQPVTIGAGGSVYMKGLIDDLRIYNRALSASDVLTLYNTGLTACANPVGYAGNMIYNAGTYHVLQYCDGTIWQPMGKVPGAGGAGCSSPVGSEGHIIYSSDYRVVQYCDGTTWRAAGRTIPIPGLVGWWNFDEGSGTTAADSSGNGNTGTLSGGTTWTTSGKINGALTFDGSSGEVATPSIAHPSTVSIAFWAKTTSTSGDLQAVSWGYWWICQLDSSNTGRMQCFDDGNTSSVSSTAVIADGNWHHFVFTATATTETLYVDGVLNASTANTMNVNSPYPFFIGAGFPGGAYFPGTIDDARIYNRALSASEVWRLYNGAP